MTLITSSCWYDFIYEVTAIPKEAKPKAINTAAGTAKMPHMLGMSPRGATIAIKPTAYENPRRSAQLISPSATSIGPSDVASMP